MLCPNEFPYPPRRTRRCEPFADVAGSLASARLPADRGGLGHAHDERHLPSQVNATLRPGLRMQLAAGLNQSVWWTSSERWIRCPDRWPDTSKTRRTGGSLMTSSRPRRSDWCSTIAGARARWPATSIRQNSDQAETGCSSVRVEAVSSPRFPGHVAALSRTPGRGSHGAVVRNASRTRNATSAGGR